MRDTEKILSMATEDVLWSGLYHSNVHESGQLETVLAADFSRFPCPFTILDASVETRALSDTHCLADCQLRLRADTPDRPTPEVQLSGSLVCSLIDGELRSVSCTLPASTAAPICPPSARTYSRPPTPISSVH